MQAVCVEPLAVVPSEKLCEFAPVMPNPFTMDPRGGTTKSCMHGNWGTWAEVLPMWGPQSFASSGMYQE